MNYSLADRPLQASDLFIAQPTSIGNGVRNDFIGTSCLYAYYFEIQLKCASRRNAETVLRNYMPEDGWDDLSSQNSKLRQDSWNLVWPTDPFINAHCDLEAEGGSEYLLFMSPEVLALLEPDILSQLRTYEPLPLAAGAGGLSRAPHIKSYARIYATAASQSGGAHTVDSQQCSCPEVAWFLLTSACLSRGLEPFALVS